jgi:hypothetical protein
MSEIAYGGTNMKPSYVYDVQDFDAALSLVPQTHKLGGLFGGYRYISIFPVPQNNAVGSNCMEKGITIISFPDGKIDYD